MAFKDLYVSDIWERSVLWVKIIIIYPGFQRYQMRSRKNFDLFSVRCQACLQVLQ